MTHTAIRLITQSAQVLGINLPGPLTNALAEHERLQAKLAEYAEQPIDLAGAITAAIAAGKDPAADRAVQRAYIAEQLQISLDRVVDASTLQLEQVVIEHTDAVVYALRGPFDDAARQLTEGHAVLGDLDLDNSRELVSRGAEAVAAWQQVQVGLTRIRQIVDGWTPLYERFRIGSKPDVRRTSLIVAVPADGNYRALYSIADFNQHNFGVWDAVKAGWTLNLATPTGFDRRVEAMLADKAKQEAAAELRHSKWGTNYADLLN